MSSTVAPRAIDAYSPHAPFADELFEPDGTPRPTAEAQGLYLGGTSSTLSATVTMSRLDPQASARA